jgi:hypothetical protein
LLPNEVSGSGLRNSQVKRENETITTKKHASARSNEWNPS